MAQQNITKIRVANPSLENNNRTYLTADIDAAGTSASVLDAKGEQFLTSGTADYYILVGDYGEEKSELRLVDASDAGTTDTAFKTDAFLFSHSASDPITYIQYNQIQIYGLSASDGTKTLITTIDVDPSQQHTEYTYDGSTYAIFVTAYYNSDLDKFSSYSDEITSTTYGRTSVRKVIESAARKAMTKIDESQTSKLSWSVAMDILNDGLGEIMTRKRKWQFLHTIDTTTTDTVASTAYIAIPSGVSELEHLIVNNQRLTWMSRKSYDYYIYSGTTLSSGNPTNYTIKNNKYYLYPTPSAAWDVIYEYYAYPTTVDALTDVINREFITILIYYCASQFAFIRGNDKRGDKMFTLFTNQLEQQVIEYSGPAQAGDAESIEFDDPNGYDDDTYLI